MSMTDPGDITRDPWSGQRRHAFVMAMTCISLICFVAFINRATRTALMRVIPASGVALGRYVMYKSTTPSLTIGRKAIRLNLPPLFICIFVVTFAVSFSIYLFTIEPYYRTDWTYGSPPLALRAASLALGLLPFVYALSNKVNLIGIVTRRSYKSLLPFHQYGGFFLFLLSCIHIAPFVVQRYKEQGASGVKAFLVESDTCRTGLAAFAILTLLVSSSLDLIRRKYYEVWLVAHIIAALSLLAILFAHTGGELTTWRYLWAATVLYGISTTLRWLRHLRNSTSYCISFGHIDCRSDIIRIKVKTTARWTPGQHFYLRFPTIDPWSSHPFSVITLCSDDPNDQCSTATFLIKQRGGLTKRLKMRHSNAIESEMASTDTLMGAAITRIPIMLDGPYGLDARVGDESEILYIAGGIGITFIISSLLHLAWRVQRQEACPRRVQLIWSVKSMKDCAYLVEHLGVVSQIMAEGSLHISVHLTENVSGSSLEELTALTRSEDANSCDTAIMLRRANVYQGRIDIGEAICGFVEQCQPRNEHLKESEEEMKAFVVVVCGPRDMTEEATRICADLQWSILSGQMTSKMSLRLIKEAYFL